MPLRVLDLIVEILMVEPRSKKIEVRFVMSLVVTLRLEPYAAVIRRRKRNISNSAIGKQALPSYITKNPIKSLLKRTTFPGKE